jgi:kinesin family protein 18/19
MPQGKRVKDQTFGFDRVFDENTTQGDVYEATTRTLLDSVLDGYNATVFAYGATGCGKTHTITGTAQQPGIIFMTMQELFEKVGELQETKESEITLSYLEIYNETIRDLLNVGAGGKQGLMLREDSNQACSVAGLSSHKPQSVEEVMDMVIRGNSARTQSPTEANATSSRSHAVLQVNVSLKDRDAAVHEPVTMATLSIIDLAGSERASVTKNRGERLLEGANINKSLLALGSCINALCDPRKKNHVPYRNSKLTRLLKFSLGGNCRTVMIVCVSPSSQHFDETQNTLRYANRAKNIQTKSVRNVYNVDRHVKDYLKKIDEQMARINELTAQQAQYEELAFVKFRKAESKRIDITHDGVLRIRAAYDNSSDERKERLNNAQRLRQIERRIGAISGWIGAFDEVCETREDEEPPAALSAIRKIASGILIELEGSRQHYHQRIARNNWTRAIDTALSDSLRLLQGLEGAIPESPEENSLRQEVELLKSRADMEIHMTILEQEKNAEAGLMRVMLTAHFETIAILNQILQMTEEDAISAAKELLGKVLQACTDATGQVVKPDGGLQITEPVAPSRHGTPRKRRQIPLAGPSPLKSKIQTAATGSAVSALPSHIAAEMQPSPAPAMSPYRGAAASPRRRVKHGGMARKGAAFAGPGTPKRKSPSKKRVVRWRDEDTDDGALVEFQATPKIPDSTPPAPSSEENSATLEIPKASLNLDGDSELASSPLPAIPVATNELRKSGASRFATGFLTKRANGSPPLRQSGVLSSDDDSSPLREMEANRAPRTASRLSVQNLASKHAESDAENSAHDNSLIDKMAAIEISSAMRQRRSSSLGSNSSLRHRESAHRRRSPTASSTGGASPPPDAHGIFSASHARRMVRSERDDAMRSVLSPRTQPIVKGSGPTAVRRSMIETGSGAPRESMGGVRPSHMRVSSIVPGSASRLSNASKAAWR